MAEDSGTRWNRRSFLKATGAVGFAAGVSSAAGASEGGSGDDYEGLLVDSYSGRGRFTVSAEEIGRRRDDPPDASVRTAPGTRSAPVFPPHRPLPFSRFRRSDRSDDRRQSGVDVPA